MKIIDRYVTEVGKRLVLVKGRKDIEKELRSNLEDMLEDRAKKAGLPRDEAMEIELLKEFGSPEKVAETYNPNPYLIGPGLFPFFIMVLKIVIGAVVLAVTIASGTQIIANNQMTTMELFTFLGKALLNLLSAIIVAFGNVTLIFALIERFAPVSKYTFGTMYKAGKKITIIQPATKEEWNPAVLMKEPQPQDVKVWEPILAIAFTFIVISIFNFNQQWLVVNYTDQGGWFVGFGNLISGKTGSIPLFSEAFFRWLPLMNITWIAEIILNGMLLRTSRWTISSRLFSIGIKLLQIVVNLLLLAGPFILGITTGGLVASKIMEANTAQTVVSILHQALRIALGLGILGKLVEIGQAGYKMVTQDISAKA